MCLDSRRGVLLVNLGSPNSPSVEDVRRYLDQFLMDGRVLDAPYPIRRFIVKCLILPFRPKKSAAAYRAIWTDKGSPLVEITRRTAQVLRERTCMPVGMGMRYGYPSIQEGLRDLVLSAEDPLDEVLLVPLYPHYAMSTYETVVVEAKRVFSELGMGSELRVLPPFYDRPEYIDSLLASAEESLEWDYDHILFSYHGLPERHLRKTDPTNCHCLKTPDCCHVESPAHKTCYRAQVLKTTQAFVDRAGIPEGKFSVAFQSRLGRDPWLQPFTSREIPLLASVGVRRLLVICPSFVSDCLETLEEIGIRERKAFTAAGGAELRLIPCLNDHPRWIETLAGWCTAQRLPSGATPA